MLNLAPIAVVMSGLLLCLLAGPLSAQSCTSCGPECVSACGSRRYRTCCFNYLRKRRSPAAPGAPPSEQLDLGPANDGLPDDLRVQLVLVPSDPDGQQEFPPSGGLTQSLLHRLLEAQGADGQGADGQGADGQGGGALGGGSAEATMAPFAASARGAPPPAPSQRHKPGAGAGSGAAGKDWLAELRHRVGLVYNV